MKRKEKKSLSYPKKTEKIKEDREKEFKKNTCTYPTSDTKLCKGDLGTPLTGQQ